MKFFAKTDLGKVRQINQDYYIAENRQVGIFPNLFVVADGVGSNKESAFASKHCSDFVLDQLSLSKNGDDYREELMKAYKLSNMDLVYRIMANPKFRGMGTTMVSTTIFNDKAIIINVGDSKCYHIRDNIKQITNDHTVAEELVKEKEIERNSTEYQELKNQLSRAFGASKKIDPDIFNVDLVEGDYLLMCTDGLSNMIKEKDIFEIINKNTKIEGKVNDLLDVANKNGGKDNITVILIYIDKIDKSESIFYKEKEEFNSRTKEALNNKHMSIKEILESKQIKNRDEFRSRKRKEGNENEEK